MGNFFSKKPIKNDDVMELLLNNRNNDLYNSIQNTQDSVSCIRERVFALEENTGTNIQLLSKDIHIIDDKIKDLEGKIDEVLQINRILAKKIQESEEIDY